MVCTIPPNQKSILCKDVSRGWKISIINGCSKTNYNEHLFLSKKKMLDVIFMYFLGLNEFNDPSRHNVQKNNYNNIYIYIANKVVFKGLTISLQDFNQMPLIKKKP